MYLLVDFNNIVCLVVFLDFEVLLLVLILFLEWLVFFLLLSVGFLVRVDLVFAMFVSIEEFLFILRFLFF